MGFPFRHALRAIVLCSTAAGLFIACGSEGDSTFDPGVVDDDASTSTSDGSAGFADSGSTIGDPSNCRPKTCAEQGIECGPAGDGCGGILENCGSCGPGLRCGGPGAPSKCVSPNVGTGCVPKTCEELGVTCGPAGDGCGGILENCGTCAAGQQCGADGMPSQCVSIATTGPDGGACIPKTANEYRAEGLNCGMQSNGCGGTVNLGGCQDPAFCGGDGPSRCGVAGGGSCTPKTCADYPGTCGPQSNGCGGVTANCGSCTGPATCGGGGVPNVCGGGVVVGPDGGTCTPRTCQTNQCGPIADGCGNILQCGGCSGGNVCGGGGVPSVCGGANQCTPRTVASCAGLGVNCGFIADGCGGPPVQCGATCPSGSICGLTTPNVCGSEGLCTNLCQDQPRDCAGGTNTTTIQGVVYMPNGRLPVYDALVYVPNAALAPVPEGVGSTCDVCDAPASGSPLILTKTNAKGEFTLSNMPHRAGGVPVVIQAGRWRKQIVVQTTRCGTVNLRTSWPQLPSQNNTTFGATQSATNHIPKYAVVSGQADALQCLLRKIGIDDSQFSNPTGTGRVNVYAKSFNGSDATTRYRNGFNGFNNNTTRNFPTEADLYGDSSTTVANTTQLEKYDALVLSCNGSGDDRQDTLAGYRDDMKQFADRGGKIFASHWHHSWLEYGPAPWNTSGGVAGGKLATILHENDLVRPLDGQINTAPSFPKGNALADWLVEANRLEGRTITRGLVSIGTTNADGAQHTVNALDDARVNRWITIPGPVDQCCGGSTCTTRCNTNPTSPNASVQYFDFNTPVGAQTQCGRFVVSDLHVSRDQVGNHNGSNVNGDVCRSAGSNNDSGFPCNCTSGDASSMSDQERVLAFMLFDLTSCVVQEEPPGCRPKTCADYPTGTCGVQSDGCGGQTPNCRTCPSGQTCGGGGVQNQCGAPTCTPATTCPAGKNCGTMPNGCGGTISCGTCPNGQVCGGGGSANVCGSASCSPRTCAQQGAQCGVVSNQCGGTVTCASCPAGQYCNSMNQCVSSTCTPRTCQQMGIQCGPAGDGCGGVIPNCGPCPAGTTCGGAGVPGQCGANACTPRTCADLGAVCGRVANGCGGLTPDCGTCEASLSCSNGQCVQACEPRTCTDAGAECGPISDGCGGIVQCGPCPAGKICGYNNRPNICGSNVPK